MVCVKKVKRSQNNTIHYRYLSITYSNNNINNNNHHHQHNNKHTIITANKNKIQTHQFQNQQQPAQNEQKAVVPDVPPS